MTNRIPTPKLTISKSAREDLDDGVFAALTLSERSFRNDPSRADGDQMRGTTTFMLETDTALNAMFTGALDAAILQIYVGAVDPTVFCVERHRLVTNSLKRMIRDGTVDRVQSYRRATPRYRTFGQTRRNKQAAQLRAKADTIRRTDQYMNDHGGVFYVRNRCRDIVNGASPTQLAVIAEALGVDK